VAKSQERYERGWFRWRPNRASQIAYEDIAAAVRDFEPVAKDAGIAAADWLKKKALDDYPATATWLNYENNRLEGFFAIRSGSFRFEETPSHRLPGRGIEKPASQIVWMCKHAESDIGGDRLISRAVGIASDVAMLQGNIALVINPYDAETAEMLHAKYAFLRCEDRSGQLWLPVLPVSSS
jgi:hypothetical protein